MVERPASAWKTKLLCFCQIPISRQTLLSIFVNKGTFPAVRSGPIAATGAPSAIPHSAMAPSPSQAKEECEIKVFLAKPEMKIAVPSTFSKKQLVIFALTTPVSKMEPVRARAQSPPEGKP